MIRLAVFSLLVFFSFSSFAQELNCTVQINTPPGNNVDPSVFTSLQKSITDFMNNRKWTGDTYASEEKIEVTLLINITQEVSSDQFNSTLTIQSNRPVFNGSYKTTVINWVDKDYQFKYQQYQNLDYNENTFSNNLTSVLAYYAYILIGYDYDSFSPSGGTPYFQKALAIVNSAQSAQEPGWKSYESTRNRYWLATELLDDKYSDFRKVLYQYHRTGLDKMYDNSDDGRKAISNCLTLLNGVYDKNPGNMVMALFFQAKSQELVNIYSQATPQEKTFAIGILSKLDASNASRYQSINKAN